MPPSSRIQAAAAATRPMLPQYNTLDQPPRIDMWVQHVLKLNEKQPQAVNLAALDAAWKKTVKHCHGNNPTVAALRRDELLSPHYRSLVTQWRYRNGAAIPTGESHSSETIGERTQRDVATLDIPHVCGSSSFIEVARYKAFAEKLQQKNPGWKPNRPETDEALEKAVDRLFSKKLKHLKEVRAKMEKRLRVEGDEYWTRCYED